MSESSPNQLGTIQLLAAFESGRLRPRDVVQACLERIFERNAEVNAFTSFDSRQALSAAEGLGTFDSHRPLYGLPFAVKDVIDTSTYPTSYGSPIYVGHMPHRDASCVALAREHGGVLLGKVATCEFATQTPSNTRNPLDTRRTPGGSSSGSAAAVADFMAPFAFGTQTTGSTIRPAVYCGIVGTKPSYGFINNAGLKPLSPEQDTITLFTREVEDAACVLYGLHGARHRPLPAIIPHIGVLRSSQWEHARPETVEAIEKMLSRMAKAGATVTEMRMPAELEAMVEIQGRISAYEARHSLVHERLLHHDQLSSRLQGRLAQEQETSPDEYFSFKQRARAARRLAAEWFQQVDVLLYPAAEGEAELGLMETGSPRYGALWTLLHLPCVSQPIAVGPSGMPLGAQFIGAYGDDFRVLAAARFMSEQAGYARDMQP